MHQTPNPLTDPVGRAGAADTTWRLIGAALALGLLCTGGVLWALRADAQSQVIKDDPTVAPDVRESADDNLTFPTDI